MPSESAIKQLLVPRRDAATMLGNVDISTIRRLEKAGLLQPKRLNPRSPTGKVFYALAEVVALVDKR